QVTRLLAQVREGDEDAVNKLMPLLYGELRALAQRHMSRERVSHTLQATAVVNEAYMRLVGADIDFKDRAHFFAVAARTMRRILVDHAKGKRRQKRGSGAAVLSLEEALVVDPTSDGGISDLDEAMQRLAALDKRKHDVIELHFFGGLTYDEIATALSVSPATVHREVRMAKAWLYRELSPDGAAEPDA
ncbi:MAG: sigma-70 family RNA polymerase sigma factor, partial [Acidobacteria bacterium]|nr:sigma-70 family RNA polymerase sigma factor [Acidobacteriota bacterium]